MNTVQDPRTVTHSVERFNQHRSEPDRSRLDKSSLKPNKERSREPTDVRISSLKILALTLLHQIESIEKSEKNNELNDINLHDEVRRFEAELIRGALVKTGGRQRRAAKLLGMKVTTLNTKIKKYQVRLADVQCIGNTAKVED